MTPTAEDQKKKRGSQGGTHQIAEVKIADQFATFADQIGAGRCQNASDPGSNCQQKQEKQSNKSSGWQGLAPGLRSQALSLLDPGGKQEGHRQQRDEHRPHQLENEQGE